MAGHKHAHTCAVRPQPAACGAPASQELRLHSGLHHPCGALVTHGLCAAVQPIGGHLLLVIECTEYRHIILSDWHLLDFGEITCRMCSLRVGGAQWHVRSQRMPQKQQGPHRGGQVKTALWRPGASALWPYRGSHLYPLCLCQSNIYLVTWAFVPERSVSHCLHAM